MSLQGLMARGINILILGLSCLGAFSQSPNDYRTKNIGIVGTAWTTLSNWETYNGTAWVNATMIPDASNANVITISPSDSLTLNAVISIDQVVINGSLGIFTSVTLADRAAEEDMVVNGLLAIGGGGNLTGLGSLQITSGGILTLRNNGRISVATVTNDGLTVFVSTFTIASPSFINNNVVDWLSGNITIDNASVTNNGTFIYSNPATTGVSFFGTAGVDAFINTSTGVFGRSTAGALTVNSNVVFDNQGTIRSVGTFTSASIQNTGVIEVAPPVGTLSLSFSVVNNKAARITIDLASSGFQAGTDYDVVTLLSTPNISLMTLELTDNADDPVGTVYTIINGPFTGEFANVILPPEIGNISYNAGASVTVERLLALPLRWGSISLYSPDSKVVDIQWSTLQEVNTAYFEIEHATDNGEFVTVGKIPAKNQSAGVNLYKYTHTNPSTTKVNRYRIRQTDIDGSFTYSIQKTLRLKKGKSGLEIYPNPFVNELYVSTEDSQSELIVSDLQGKQVFITRLKKGTQTVSIGNLIAGSYVIYLRGSGYATKSSVFIKR